MKSSFITGSNPGFGRPMAEKLMVAGARVAGTVHSVSSVDNLKVTYGGRLWVPQLDLTQGDAIRGTVGDA